MTMPPQARQAFRPMEDMPAPLGAQESLQAQRPTSPAPLSKSPAGKAPSQVRTDKLPDASRPAGPTLGDTDPDRPPSRVVIPVPKDTVPKDTVPKDLTIPKELVLPKAESVPRIVPEDVAVTEPLELVVSAPSRRQVGTGVTFRLSLRNSGDRPQTGLAIRCRFDDGLVFAGSDRREVLQRFDRLSAGESRDVALTLTGKGAGSHCCWFTLTRQEGAKDVEVVSRQVCVEFATRPVEIDIAGPAQRTEGSRAEFNVTLTNRSLKTIESAQALVTFDKALVPKEASAGAEQRSGSLAWRLGSLAPLEKVQLQVEFECRTQAHRASVAVEVKGANLDRDQDEACVEIIPVPGTLDLQISDRQDPLERGQSGTYEVTVENIGLQAVRRVVLEAVTSDNIQVRGTTVRVGDAAIPLKSSTIGNKLVFDPLEQIEPGARVTFVFEVDALRSGQAEFRASLTSALSGTPVSATEPTIILDP
jgi:hypothetical protein